MLDLDAIEHLARGWDPQNPPVGAEEVLATHALTLVAEVRRLHAERLRAELERGLGTGAYAAGHRDGVAALEAQLEGQHATIVRLADRCRRLEGEVVRLSACLAEAIASEARAVTKYQRVLDGERPAQAALDDIRGLLQENGCDCPCEHHHEEHADDCERCLACCVQGALPEARP